MRPDEAVASGRRLIWGCLLLSTAWDRKGRVGRGRRNVEWGRGLSQNIAKRERGVEAGTELGKEGMLPQAVSLRIDL